MSTEETILLVNGSRNMAWEGVRFQHATWDQPSTARSVPAQCGRERYVGDAFMLS